MTRYIHNEANWGPVTETEVPQGSHLTFEIPLRLSDSLVALRLRHGIHGGSPDKLYFPHGLIRFGETVPDAVARLVREICEVEVASLRHTFVEAWLDESQHYHICCTVVATISGLPKKTDEISEVFQISKSDNLPGEFAWWSDADIKNLFEHHWG